MTDRLCYSKTEAAELVLGVSLEFFNEHVLMHLRVVRRGRRCLIPRRELEFWIEKNAAHTLNQEYATDFREQKRRPAGAAPAHPH